MRSERWLQGPVEENPQQRQRNVQNWRTVRHNGAIRRREIHVAEHSDRIPEGQVDREDRLHRQQEETQLERVQETVVLHTTERLFAIVVHRVGDDVDGRESENRREPQSKVEGDADRRDAGEFGPEQNEGDEMRTVERRAEEEAQYRSGAVGQSTGDVSGRADHRPRLCVLLSVYQTAARLGEIWQNDHLHDSSAQRRHLRDVRHRVPVGRGQVHVRRSYGEHDSVLCQCRASLSQVPQPGRLHDRGGEQGVRRFQRSAGQTGQQQGEIMAAGSLEVSNDQQFHIRREQSRRARLPTVGIPQVSRADASFHDPAVQRLDRHPPEDRQSYFHRRDIGPVVHERW